MLQNPCKTLGFMKNMVYKIPPGGGGKPYPASGLNVAQSKSNDVHNNPGYEYDSGRVYTICMVISSGARPDLVA